jgi:aminoglycoside/choline kinase family phosphotransferase
MADFPLNPDELTAGFVGDALEARGIPSGSVASIDVRKVPTTGMYSRLAAMTIRYTHETQHAPRSLFVKFAPAHEGARRLAHVQGLFRAEVGFYRDIGEACGLRVPRCWFAGIDDATGEFLLLLEDLSNLSTGDWLSCPPDDVVALVDSMAAMHGRWWNQPRLGELAWLLDHQAPATITMLRRTYEERAVAYAEQYAGEMPESYRRFCIELRDRPETWSRIARSPRTLLHGDLYVNQAMFGGQDGPVIIDWQFACAGHPACDLSRVMLCFSTPVRRARERDCLDRYHRQLVAHGVREYSRADLDRDYATGLLWNHWLVSGSFVNADIDVVRRYTESRGSSLAEAFDRLASWVEDWQPLASGPA